MLAAKERSIDSLRETLSTTKRNLETRSEQAETTLAAREADVHRLLAEVGCCKPHQFKFNSKILQSKAKFPSNISMQSEAKQKFKAKFKAKSALRFAYYSGDLIPYSGVLAIWRANSLLARV